MERIGVEANVFTFNILIHVLCRNGDSSKVNTFLDRMEDEGFDPDVVTLINSYCRRGKMQDAFYLYKIMSVRGVMPHLVTYTVLMNGLCKAVRAVEVHQMLNEIVYCRGSSPDILMLNILVAGYCKEGKMTEAKALLHSMIGNGVWPDDFTFQVLVEGYGKIGKLISALNLVKEFHKFQFSVPLPHDVYKFLIMALCKEDRIFTAKNLLDRSFQDRYKPDNETYSELVGALCRNNRVDDALLLNDEIIFKNCQLKLEACRTMIGCLSKMGRPDDAKKVMMNMVESLIKPDSTICRSLVTGYCNIGEVEIAEMVLAFATEFQILDTKSLNILSAALSEEGNVQKLIDVQEKMLKLGYTPNEATCKYIISGLPKKVKFKRLYVLEE